MSAAPPRIVLCVNTSWNVVNFRANLIRALIGAGFDVVVLSPQDRRSPEIALTGARWIATPMDNKGVSPVNDAALFFRLWREMRRLKPVAYLGFTIKPNVYGAIAARLVGARPILNVSGLGTAFIRDGWLTRLVKALYRLSLSAAETVFFQNPDDRALFVSQRLAPERKTRLLPGSGVDLAHFAPAPQPARPEGETAFLLVARLLWDKGVREYVEAARMVRARHPGARFRLAGMLDVENRTAVDAASVAGWVAEGLIDYLGPLDDVRPALIDADVVVLPSYREGTPRALLEAAATGRPVIATDVPGCREVVEPGVTGLTCAVRDAADLARAMEAMIAAGAKGRAAMGAAGRAMVERSFDERQVIAAYLEAVG